MLQIKLFKDNVKILGTVASLTFSQISTNTLVITFLHCLGNAYKQGSVCEVRGRENSRKLSGTNYSVYALRFMSSTGLLFAVSTHRNYCKRTKTAIIMTAKKLWHPVVEPRGLMWTTPERSEWRCRHTKQKAPKNPNINSGNDAGQSANKWIC